MRRLLLSLTLVALVAPAGALAGGWATAGLSPPPDDVGAGDTWNARITVLQHGQTPLEGVEPIVMIRNGSTKKAKVVFPTAGTWSYVVDDGFGQTHTFAPASIGSGGGGLPFFAIIGIGALALAAIVLVYLLARRVRVRAPAPSH